MEYLSNIYTPFGVFEVIAPIVFIIALLYLAITYYDLYKEKYFLHQCGIELEKRVIKCDQTIEEQKLQICKLEITIQEQSKKIKEFEKLLITENKA
ncbi:hypothetical protein GCM10028807_17410 [Spirosoma daeguense]